MKATVTSSIFLPVQRFGGLDQLLTMFLKILQRSAFVPMYGFSELLLVVDW